MYLPIHRNPGIISEVSLESQNAKMGLDICCGDYEVHFADIKHDRNILLLIYIDTGVSHGVLFA